MENQVIAGVLTISDKGSRGERVDKSGEILVELIKKQGYIVAKKKIIPDNLKRIEETLIEWVEKDDLALIVTSGGTGLTPSDLTPQATKKVIDFEVPGMAEAMRAQSLKITPHAMISRAIVGVRRSCLIINLPGSPGGAKDNFSVVLPALNHALLKLAGDPSDCAT